MNNSKEIISNPNSRGEHKRIISGKTGGFLKKPIGKFIKNFNKTNSSLEL